MRKGTSLGVVEVLQQKSLQRPQTWEGWGSFLLVATLPQTQVVENVSCYPETKGAGAGSWHVLPFGVFSVGGTAGGIPRGETGGPIVRTTHTEPGRRRGRAGPTDTQGMVNRHLHQLVPQRRGQRELSLGRGGGPARASWEVVVSAHLPGRETIRLRERRVELGLSVGRPGWWRQDASQVRFLRRVEGRLRLRT